VARQQHSKEFLKLQAQWYKKAAKSEYLDIEQDEDNLKIWDGHRIKAKYTPETFQAKQEYYIMAGQFLYNHEFKSTLDRKIWEMHAEGLTAPEIVVKLKRYKIKLHTIHAITKNLSNEMLSCLKKT
jgi:nucleoside-specific outer membrane channel protein Tsx